MTYTDLAFKAGISPAYASQLLSGKRKCASLDMALRIYDATGLQLGALANLTAREIETQRNLMAKAA